jgi:hypothetical protein
MMEALTHNSNTSPMLDANTTIPIVVSRTAAEEIDVPTGFAKVPWNDAYRCSAKDALAASKTIHRSEAVDYHSIPEIENVQPNGGHKLSRESLPEDRVNLSLPIKTAQSNLLETPGKFDPDNANTIPFFPVRHC